MYLKGIEIQGFKSFADKTKLEFNDGITSVIGPNGSGKSNISDAVRWVLGEQSVKTLRGGKMEDVIFAGTEYRKPVGFAEVSLTIDNMDHSLPVEFSEVTITRRLYRSGESEYLINKTACRLKDIHELFLDTGLGKDGYSIIGQGRVDEILSNRSEDRRLIFEEASGIMKYKVKKNEAEKKLDLTQQNLIRINDIISELESQIEPLRIQSDTAKRYLSFRDNLKELEVNLYIENIGRFKEKVVELDESYKLIKQNIEDENNKLESITHQNQQKTELLKSYEEKLSTLRLQFYEIETNIEKYNSDIKLNEEKASNIETNSKRLDTEVSELSGKLDQIAKEETSKHNKILYLQNEKEEYSKKLNQFENQMRAILELLDENERHIEHLKDCVSDKLDILSDKKSQISNVKHHLESLKRRQNTIEIDIYHSVLEKERDNIKKEDVQTNIQNMSQSLKLATKKQGENKAEKLSFEKSIDEQSSKLNSLRSDINVKLSKQKMLENMERNLEGYNRSVKEILNICKESSDFGRGIYGALAQLISVDKKYELAVETSLGGALQNIVTESEEDAKRAIELLKKNKLGRATFLPITSVKGRYLEQNIVNQVSKCEGYINIASDLVICKDEFKGIILNLLGKVIIVNNIDNGIQIARKFGYSFRIVTLDGDVLNAGGALTGGSFDSRTGGILGRGREIIEIKENIEVQKAQEHTTLENLKELNDMLKDIIAELSSEEEKIRNIEISKVREESQFELLDINVKKAIAKIEMLNEEKNQLNRQEESTNIELVKYSNELLQVETEMQETKIIISEHQDKHKESQLERDNLHSDITDFKISVNSIIESLNTVNESVDKIASEKAEFTKGIERRNREKAKNIEDSQALVEKNIGYNLQIKKCVEEKTGKNLQIESMVEERRILEDEMSEALSSLKNANKNIMLLQEDFGRIEVKRAKIETEMESIQNRLWDEYELTYNNALEFKKDIGSFANAQKLINEYRTKIKELGVINVAAIDEYVKTKERFEFMSAQKEDMEQAKEKLNKIIHEITSQMKHKFIEQFKLINTNFNQVFKELFEGGRAELKLVDEQNVLESGIEIEVQPPGKKLQNMMLLSGGERAFTAIALLFAILRLSPTPFCILDEIEAALDDANVIRFSQYLKGFSEKTQFIVVTHRKGTMEASDTLYGVTMQEQGISRIVSMRLGEKAS